MSFLDIQNKNFVVFGLGNKKSIACHVGRRLLEEGARVLYVVHTEENKEIALQLFPECEVHVCDVGIEEQVFQVAETVKEKLGVVHGILHSIAYANYSEGPKPFHETNRDDFLQAMDISCFSLIRIANHFKNLLVNDGSVVTISISTTTMASENYGYMAPVKAALDSSLCFLAKSFSHFSNVRFNAVKSGLLKTKASAGIPNYVNSFLYAESLTLRKQALKTEEVADAAVFLLSPVSSGLNTESLVLDAGMHVNYFDRNIVDRAMRVDPDLK